MFVFCSTVDFPNCVRVCFVVGRSLCVLYKTSFFVFILRGSGGVNAWGVWLALGDAINGDHANGMFRDVHEPFKRFYDYIVI